MIMPLRVEENKREKEKIKWRSTELKQNFEMLESNQTLHHQRKLSQRT